MHKMLPATTGAHTLTKSCVVTRMGSAQAERSGAPVSRLLEAALPPPLSTKKSDVPPQLLSNFTVDSMHKL